MGREERGGLWVSRGVVQIHKSEQKENFVDSLSEEETRVSDSRTRPGVGKSGVLKSSQE